MFLIDINLGTGMNGIEFAKTLRTDQRYKMAPFVAITAYSLDQIEEHGGSGVFYNYISKPFTPEDILIYVESVLGRHIRAK